MLYSFTLAYQIFFGSCDHLCLQFSTTHRFVWCYRSPSFQHTNSDQWSGFSKDYLYCEFVAIIFLSTTNSICRCREYWSEKLFLYTSILPLKIYTNCHFVENGLEFDGGDDRISTVLWNLQWWTRSNYFCGVVLWAFDRK